MFLNKKYIYAVISFSLIVLLWQMVVVFSGWSVQVFPGPLVVFYSFIELVSNGALFNHSVASLYRVTTGFYLGAVLGVPLGIILGRSVTVKQLVNPVIQFLRPISPLAWIPLSMLWFGLGDKPAIFLIFLSSFFPIVVATTIAVNSINPIYFQVASNFNLSRLEMLTKIVVPAIIPEVVTALRLTIAIAWLVVVAAEMIAVQSGLGYLILDSRNALRMDYVMVAMIVIGLIGLLLDFIMYKLGKLEPMLAAGRNR